MPTGVVSDPHLVFFLPFLSPASVMPILTHRLKVVSYKDISNDGLGVDLSFGNPCVGHTRVAPHLSAHFAPCLASLPLSLIMSFPYMISSLAVRNTALVAEYLSICPGLGELVMALTDWIAVNVHKLSAYAIFMLAVFYLQVRKRVASTRLSTPAVVCG